MHKESGNGDHRPFYITTGHFEERDRFGAFREEIVLRHCHTDIETPDKSDFSASVLHLDLPSMGLARTSMLPCNLFRTRRLLRDGDDTLVFTLCLEGELQARFSDDQARLAPGAAMLTTRAMTGGFSADRSTRYFAVNIGRDIARSLVPAPERLVLKQYRADDPTTGILHAYLAGLLTRQQALPPHMVALVDRQVRELLGAVLGPMSEFARAEPYGGVKAARLQAIRRDIAIRLHDQQLNAENVGRRLGVSGRYVQQLMEGAGASFSAYVRELRLDHARQMLRDPRFNHLRITDICEAAGFSDLSSFNHAFRNRFDQSPGDARRQALS